MAFVKNREQFLSKSGTLHQMVIFSTFDSDRKYAIRIGSWIFLGEHGTFYYKFELYVKK